MLAVATMVTMHFISALIQVESRGNDAAVGDYVHGLPTSFGCLQISQKVLDDVSRFTGFRISVAQAFRRKDAIRICQAYLDHWATAARLGHEPTNEDRARIWNGGPLGWRKRETLAYWAKVRYELENTDDGTWVVTAPKRPRQ